MTAVDAFMYAGEVEALSIRWHELRDTVDVFLAVEGLLTFQGAAKAATIRQDWDAIGADPARLWTVVVPERCFPTEPGEWQTVAWAREAHQRNALASHHGLRDLPGDTVMLLSDVDEVLNRAAVPRRLSPGDTGRVCMQHSFYFLNLRCVSFGHWHGTRVIRLDDLMRTTPQALRGFGIGHEHLPGDRLLYGGNHFSFLGGADAIQRKLAAWAHTERNDLNTPENVQRALQALSDWDPERAAQLVPVPLDDSFPACIREHPERYSVLPVGVPA